MRKHRHDSKPTPEIFIESPPWFGLCPIVTPVWLVAIPFPLVYVAIEFIVQALFGNSLRRSHGSDWTHLPG